MAAHAGTTTISLEAAFRSARDDFLASLPANVKVDISKIATADDVYKAAEEIQKQQAVTKTLRGLERIKPFIRALQEFSGVLDTFSQISTDVFCPIWGALKFLLQTASALTAAFEKIVKVLGEIGRALPSFKQYADLFPSNDGILRAFCLFFEDMLSFYAVLLNFVTNKRLSVIIEPFWPRVRAKIDMIQENIKNHTALLTVNVTLEDISGAQQARKRALEEYDRAAKFRDQQTFRAIRDEVRPEMYHERLADLLQLTSKGSGAWLDGQTDFTTWLNCTDGAARCLWLSGIPGAGKTHLAANIVNRMQKSKQCVLFAFISHEQQLVGRTIAVLKSFLFQALEADPSLRLVLPDASDPEHTKLARDYDYLKDLLCRVLQSLGPVFLVLDGLDEIEEVGLGDLLSTVIDIKEKCGESKILVSSRELRGIGRVLEKHVVTVRIDKHNHEDIQRFVRAESDSLLLELEDYGPSKKELSEVRDALESVAEKSEGMFLYAKLVLCVVKDYRTLQEIQAEVNNLPDGLDQAYGRLISRIEGKTTTPKLRTVVRSILMWVACAARPLREEELLQILVIEIGEDDFTRGRKEYRDICQACGPIIEIANGVIRFVHFSAKEYLLDKQSNRFLNLADAHLNAALTCTTYLSFSSLDILFPEAEESSGINTQILSGDFVFLEYAVLEYMGHIKAWVKHRGSQDSTEAIFFSLHRLFETRGNEAFDELAPSKEFLGHFALFHDNPNLQRSLASAASFLTGAEVGMLAVDETTGPSPNDPLALFSALAEFRRHLEAAACNTSSHGAACPCQTLEKLYGPRRYCCRRLYCSAYVSGFPTKEARDQHLKEHSRNFKCPEADCVFARTGFRSSSELSRHTALAHRPFDMPAAGVGNSGLLVLPEKEQRLLLENAIKGSHLHAVQQLLPAKEVEYRLLRLAAVHSTPELLAWLLDSHPPADVKTGDEDVLAGILSQAFDGENRPNIKLLLSRGANIMARARETYYSVSNSPAIIWALSRWNGDLMKFLIQECGVTLPPTWPNNLASPAALFYAPHLREASLEDARRRFAATKPYVPWPETFRFSPYYAAQAGSPSLLRVALENGGDPNGWAEGSVLPLHACCDPRISNCAEMIKILLEFGANLNLVDRPPFPSRFNNQGWTALSEVARRRSGDHVEVAKFLLEQGADPNVGGSPLYHAVSLGRAELVKLLLQHKADPYPGKINGTKNMLALAGRKKIERYFGAPWSDIVHRIQEGEDLEGGQVRRGK